MPEPRFIDGLEPCAGHYDGYIIDQWGVLHDGTAPYPGALTAVGQLLRLGKKVVLLSNSGRRTALNRQRLEGLGFELERFTAIVTSGEACWQLMHDQRQPPWSELGRRCLLLTHLGDLGVMEGLGLERVQAVGEADFIFCSGLDEQPSLEGMRPLAEAGVRLDLPMICSNPDLVAVSAGELIIAPGSFARIYEELGGTVHYVGKPYRPIYDACLAALEGIDLERIVAIGDSLEHDVRGANGVGLASIFIEGGILGSEFPPEAAVEDKRAALERLCTSPDLAPTWSMPRLGW